MPNKSQEPSKDEIVAFFHTLTRMNPVQLAGVSGTALGLAERKARHTTIPVDHYLTKHIPIQAGNKPLR